ncbi:hypothetical protein AYJ54_00030 [Bradyrhizobium centrolobii]|uniref:Uncharacterized protein n=1 Tax=Bradyrhizobium centrolobii TaxID=1505087 RepID=A0A176YMP4_9BRAD|nr:hypothetical protein AYJ54_25770 [Bradyrhizobium centrolobii]OAF04430.1 hypothetical protein AYJ54_24045 [Bradyrhizobium centrolobii]OAF07413.1 hypothetical protein AYJ54_17795 [Bradyrhizobium centrolobii]OAF09181.1 hypothetical protein AYJ54_00030 [Bradyrhizobium centrolobii]
MERSTVLLCVPCQGALFSLVEVQAGKLSLQPEVLGAGQEATNDLKHSEKRPLLGVIGPRGPQLASEHRAGSESVIVGADPP